MKKKLTFVIVDDHFVITKYMSLLLKDLYKNSEIHTFNSLKGVTKFVDNNPIDLIILDISFSEDNAINYISKFKILQPNVKILIFSGLDENFYAMRCLQEGANSYLSKLSTEDEIKNAIKEVIIHSKYLSKNLHEKIVDNFIYKRPLNPFDQLTSREFEITQLLVKGLGNIEICNILNIKKSTVSTYKNNIFEKLNVDNLSELIRIFNKYKI